MDENEIVRRHFGMVQSIVSRFRVHQRADRDDLVSVGLAALLTAIRTYQPDRSCKPISWYYRIVWQRLKEHCRKERVKARRLTLMLYHDLENVEAQDHGPGADYRTVVAAAERFMRPKQLSVFRAIFLEGRSQSDVSRERGISRAGVWDLVNRFLPGVRERVRSVLGKDIEETAAGRSGRI